MMIREVRLTLVWATYADAGLADQVGGGQYRRALEAWMAGPEIASCPSWLAGWLARDDVAPRQPPVARVCDPEILVEIRHRLSAGDKTHQAYYVGDVSYLLSLLEQ